MKQHGGFGILGAGLGDVGWSWGWFCSWASPSVNGTGVGVGVGGSTLLRTQERDGV